MNEDENEISKMKMENEISTTKMEQKSQK